MDGRPDDRARDLARQGAGLAIGWGMPVAMLVLSIPAGPAVKTALWTTALAWMGSACLLNAVRCRRRHCYLTGPFFLFMAAAALLHGSGIVPLGSDGWTVLGAVVGIGGIALWMLPDVLLGPYVDR